MNFIGKNSIIISPTDARHLKILQDFKELHKFNSDCVVTEKPWMGEIAFYIVTSDKSLLTKLLTELNKTA